MNQSAEAIRILDANINVPYGIFSIIDGSGYFPPLAFLNAFLLQGSDPCDQDGRMGTWRPFALTSEEYATVKNGGLRPMKTRWSQILAVHAGMSGCRRF